MGRWLAVLAVVLALEGQAAPLEPVTLQLKWKHQFQFAGYYVAEAKGYYREAGLDVRFVEASPGLQPIEEVLSGRAQFGVGTTDLLLYRHRGAKVVAVAAIFQHSPLALMTLGTGAGLEALRGQVVMVEPHSAELEAFLSRSGLGRGAVQEVEHSFDVQDLVTGRAAAMSAYVTDEPWALASIGQQYSLYSPRAAGIDFYGDLLFTTQRFIDEHPAVVTAFRAASLKGWREALANPEAAVELVLARSDRKARAHLEFEAQAMAPLLQFDLVEPGYMSTTRWQHIAEVYAETGMLPAGVDLEGFLYRPVEPTPRWVLVALGSLGLLALAMGAAAAFAARVSLRTRESEARFRTLFENSADPCFLLRGGRVLDCNPAAARALGLQAREALVGHLVSAHSPATQGGGRPSTEVLTEAERRALEEGVHRLEWDFMHADGRVLPLRLTLSRLRVDGQAVVYASGQDISQARHLEHSLRQASAEALAASQLKSRFLANMSHEVRTPLAAILGVAELGRLSTSLTEAREYFELVASSGDTLLALANDILDVSRLEAGRLRIEAGPVDVRALVADTVGLLRAQAEKQGLRLEVRVDEALPPRVLGDRVRVRQVLTNLLSNAVKFTERGSIVVDARYADDHLTLAVTDTGVGLTAAQQARLFQPFTQLDESPTRRHGGAGLGLALSRQLMRLMGGDLSVRSAPGEGSTFTCVIPAPSMEAPELSGPEKPAVDLAGLHVLVVEDNKVNQLLAAAMLRRAGASWEIADNGRVAVERLVRGPKDFHAVLMDLQMPECDGLTAMGLLRQHAALATLPVIALTAHALEDEVARCLAAGMQACLTKPIQPARLYETIARFTGRLGSGPAAS